MTNPVYFTLDGVLPWRATADSNQVTDVSAWPAEKVDAMFDAAVENKLDAKIWLKCRKHGWTRVFNQLHGYQAQYTSCRKCDKEAAAERIGDCSKCGGSGTYQYGWDGQKFTKSGTCFDCRGKGHMDVGDGLRDNNYHNKYERISE
jgi:hypothetical protein